MCISWLGALACLMYDSIFKDNHARGGTYLENKGGAIAAMDGVDLRIENSTFINNTAVGDGGAILVTTLCTLYAGLIFYQRWYFSSYILIIVEFAVIILNASYYDMLYL